jgi:cell wall-associated NlpC family hydrolase
LVLSYEERVLGAAVRKVGSPYIWNGKGELRTGTVNGIPGIGYHGYDCSGLVTSSMREAGGPDLRATHNAQKLFDEGQVTDALNSIRLAFFGKKNDDGSVNVSHVTIEFGSDANFFTVESAGGGPTTTEPSPEAQVMIHKGRWEGPNHTLQGWRTIPR